MPQAKVNRPELVIDGKTYALGAVVEVPEREYRNLLTTGKLVAANIDAKLAQSGSTLTEQAEVNLAEAKGVMAGPVVASDAAEEPATETPAAKPKKLTAKSAQKKATK